MKKLFISYSHKQRDWVSQRLTPCLAAGGVEVLIDDERFQAGKAVVGQMDAVQDKADVHVLVLSEDYLTSKFCRHEMDRAIARREGGCEFGSHSVSCLHMDERLAANVNRETPAKVSRT